MTAPPQPTDQTVTPSAPAADPAFLDNLVAEWPGARETPSAAIANTIPKVLDKHAPQIEALIAQCRQVGATAPAATVALLQALAAEIRAGTTLPGNRVEQHAARLDRALTPSDLPVFIRARRAEVPA